MQPTIKSFAVIVDVSHDKSIKRPLQVESITTFASRIHEPFAMKQNDLNPCYRLYFCTAGAVLVN